MMGRMVMIGLRLWLILLVRRFASNINDMGWRSKRRKGYGKRFCYLALRCMVLTDRFCIVEAVFTVFPARKGDLLICGVL